MLVIDDEVLVVEVVSRYLEREGFQVYTAADGPSGWSAFADCRPHLVVLDLMLPGADGIEICRRIRGRGRTPVIMLTARGDEMDRIAGFEVGADDYLAKPFSPRELVARIRAVLRRSYDSGPAGRRGTVEANGLTLDLTSRRVTVEGRQVELTSREADLLAFLMANPGRLLSRDLILRRVWDESWYGDPATVTVHIRRLRCKIEADPDRPRRIQTVWGAGYRWDA